jgi:ABC-type branched-subunit amino acid transport system substrate-binding protein
MKRTRQKGSTTRRAPATGKHRRRGTAAVALRPLTLGAAAVGLTVGLLGAGAAGATSHANRSHASRSHASTSHTGGSKPITNYPAYVGGHGKANPKLSPIYIGAVNQQTAPDAPTPLWTTGVKVAVDYVNQHTGGIDGHPLKVVYCAIPTTVSSAEKCGQEFANNHNIVAVMAGGIDVGMTALEAALKPTKKPIFWDVSLSPVDETYPYGFIWWNTDAYVNAPYGAFAKEIIHAKSVSLIYPSNITAEVTQANTVYAALKYAGITDIHKVGYTGAQSDLAAPLEAAQVSHTTLTINVDSGGPTCSDLALNLKSLGLATKVKVVTDVPCTAPTVAKADGGQLPHDWYYLTAQAMPGSNTPSLTTVAKSIFTEYGKGPVYADAWAEMGISLVTTIDKLDTQILKAHKQITPATLFAAARAFKGPVLQGAPHLDCGGYSTPATCNDLDEFFQNTAPGVMKRLSTWIGPAKGFKPPRPRS